MEKLIVDLGNRSYPIYIGQNLLGNEELVARHVKSEQVFIVTNETVAPLYLEKTQAAFKNFQVAHIVLPDGEEFKNLEVLNHIFTELLMQRFDRQATLVALGGGVIGDMTGFAAACYQRGVPFIQIPTTLLAQVDASVGGKTGVNHAQGKNMIGAFHQPQCVIIDTNTLKTLENRELSAGLAEVIKYGLINDAEFFEWLENHGTGLLAREAEALNFAIARCCQDKADIVAQDEREKGMRALLNLGHTFGHPIETAMNYQNILHGEGVAIGMCLAAQLSARQGWFEKSDLSRVIDLIRKMQLPTTIPTHLSSENLLALMKVDKKVQKGKVRFVLLKGIGKAFITENYDPKLLRETLDNKAIASSA